MLDRNVKKRKKLKQKVLVREKVKIIVLIEKDQVNYDKKSVATQVLVDKNKAFIEGLTRVRNQFIENRDAAEAANRGIRKGLEDVNAEIRRLNNAQFQIVELSKTLGSSFQESFKDIKGQ